MTDSATRAALSALHADLVKLLPRPGQPWHCQPSHVLVEGRRVEVAELVRLALLAAIQVDARLLRDE